MIEKEHKLNWVARLTGFFINNRQLSIILFGLVAVLGIVSLLNLRREGFPQVPAKVAIIQTTYKGAGPAEVERSVTTPLETALKGNKNIKEMSSQSVDNVSLIQAIIEPNADLGTAIQDINSKVASVQLPKDAEKPEISQPTSGDAAFMYGLTGDLSAEEIVRQGQIFSREIGQAKGVKEVKANPEVDIKVRVIFDTAKLAAAGVDVANLSQVIATNNFNLPAGQITSGNADATIIFAGRYESLDQLADTRLPTIAGKPSVRLGDVAVVKSVVDAGDKLTRFGYQQDGEPVGASGVVYSIFTRDDADILNVDKELQTTIERLKSEKVLDSRVKLARVYDQAEATRLQINEIKNGAFGETWHKLGVFGVAGILFGGIWLLAIAMALFVNLRAALVAVLAVPLSFFVAVIALYAGGITLNTLTLFSMILVLGLVVDPVIVVLEALQRYKDRGYEGIEAPMRAVDSIGLGVLMAVLISTIVFTPFGIVSGVFGEIIRFIPITVIPALIASFFIPILFLTALGNRLLKSHHKEGDDRSEEASLWRSSLWFRRFNRAVLRRWWAQVPIIAVAAILPIAIAGYFFGTGKIESVQFSKPSDTESMSVSISYPPARSFESVQGLAKQSESAINKHPEVRSYFYLFQEQGSFMIFVNLTQPNQRQRTADEIVAAINRDLPREKGKIFATAETVSAGPPQPEFPVQLQIYESNPDKLKKFAVAAGQYLKGVGGVKRVSDGYNDGSPDQITITPNTTALDSVGLASGALGGQLAGLLSHPELTKLQTADGEVVVESEFSRTSQPASIEDIKALNVNTPSGPKSVGALASVNQSPGTGPIQHFNGSRFATVRAQLNDGANQFEVQSKLNDWAKDHRSGYGLRQDALTSKGEGDEIAKSFGELFMALGAAILLTYAVLVVFFRSFLQPLIITFAVPLSFIGVFPALYFFGGGQFGFLEILGMITLVGIVENVGIFVIDYANRRVKEGMDHRDAIALATAVRFRPIFLTKVVLLGSLLPLAVVSPFWRGLAGVIVAGVLTSGIVSLFTTPILYHWVYNLSHVRTILRRRFSRHVPEPVKAALRPRRVRL